MTIDQRLQRIERKATPTIPGTQICRVLTESGMKWSVGIGRLGMPKEFIIRDTIGEALRVVEKSLRLRHPKIIFSKRGS